MDTQTVDIPVFIILPPRNASDIPVQCVWPAGYIATIDQYFSLSLFGGEEGLLLELLLLFFMDSRRLLTPCFVLCAYILW
jgi:hypothetical protein